MTEANSSKSQVDYEDDFEKDLDWLISEEGQSEQGSDYGDVDAEIDKELEKEETPVEEIGNGNKDQKPDHVKEDEERWPPPMVPLAYDMEQASTSLHAESPFPETDEQTDVDQKYILDKIEQANKELEEQDTPDMTRQRRLQFKDTLVDLVVPPPLSDSYSDDTDEEKERALIAGATSVVSGMLSNLIIDSSGQISSKDRASKEFRRSSVEGLQETKESKVLVEKDGNGTQTSAHLQPSFQLGTDQLKAPRPPTRPKARPNSARPNSARPNSASQGQRFVLMRNGKRRVQSATGTPSKATFALSLQQKDLLQKMKEKKERLAREAEQKKREEEELKKQENEQAFKSWLIRKREQIFEERKIHHAKEIERMNAKRDVYDPEEAYRSWLQKKKEQVQKERQVVELRKLEEECNCLMHSRQECDRAFNLWLKQKRDEKRAQQLLNIEQSRRMAVDVRRARRMNELLCAVNASRPFQFTDDSAYRY
ncbi:coiled-coil domain-containing protein 181 isoform X2 [Poecilia reticulata]|uniref:coiled-coil domain-containing protein 181 isoform X2 n=1 Tax=Poecilia reticulata TaxID=8081 RepID=UPI0004A4360E|nr:PREDICTED: coiled-coil domain-containing protein 181 isoform X2 [Poecilia reticulata]